MGEPAQMRVGSLFSLSCEIYTSTSKYLNLLDQVS